jgi:uncharacterized protein
LNWHLLFHSESGALRAPWRIFLFCLASSAAFIAIEALAAPLIAKALNATGLGDQATDLWVSVFALLAGTAISLRLIDKRSWREVWLDRPAARPSLLGFGFVIGALAIGLPIILLIGVHWLRDVPGASGSWLAAAARATFFLLPAALLEELMTRGYILSALRQALGWKRAIALTSVAFGLLHLRNNGANAESVTLVTLAGFFLAAVLYATRSLYAAWMAHFAWNWTMAVLFHSAVSGFPVESPRYRYVDAGPDWATGGVWGPEGGAPAGLGMAGGIVYLLARRSRARRDQEK